MMPTRPPTVFDYEDVWRELSENGHQDWADTLRQACQQALQADQHGQLSGWLELLQQIPVAAKPDWHIADGRVVVGQYDPAATPNDITRPDSARHCILQQFCPWRKGPWQIGDVRIDTEWRSDWKWNRIAGCVEWRDRRVLDVGCGNGYFGWQMLNAGARSVIGLDPFLLFVMQHEIVRRSTGRAPNYVLPLSDTSLVADLQAFDIALSMGVLYHRTSPVDHLRLLREALRPGGRLVLETLIVQSDERTVLVPEDRYAKMRNVWFIPSPSMLTLWLRRVGFSDIQIVDVTPTTPDEQRSTDWMTFESLGDFLNPANSSQTIEGDPAPVRTVITCTRQ